MSSLVLLTLLSRSDVNFQQLAFSKHHTIKPRRCISIPAHYVAYPLRNPPDIARVSGPLGHNYHKPIRQRGRQSASAFPYSTDNKQS
jgi:hypothetical protein